MTLSRRVCGAAVVGAILALAAGPAAGQTCGHWVEPAHKAMLDPVTSVVSWLPERGEAMLLATTASGPIGAKSNVIRWTGADWTLLDSGAVPKMNRLFVADGRLLGSNDTNVFERRAGVWQSVGAVVTTVNSALRVRALCTVEGRLYAGGQFSAIGGATATNAAEWDGEKWVALGDGPGIVVEAMVEYQGALLAAGWKPGPTTYQNTAVVTRWDGTAWSAFGTDVGTGKALAMRVIGGDLFVGGDIRSPSGRRSVALWTGTDWRALTGWYGTVEALVEFKDELVAIGNLMRDVPGRFGPTIVGKWDGLVWQHVPVEHPEWWVGKAGAVHDGRLIIATARPPGSFSSSSRQAMLTWDGAATARLDGEVDGPVTALVSHEGDLIVGGEFLHAGSLFARRVARRTRTAWEAMGGGLSGPVEALAVHDGTVYAAYRPLAGVPPPGREVARWTRGEWLSTGPIPNLSLVTGLTSYQGRLILSSTNRMYELEASGWKTLPDSPQSLRWSEYVAGPPVVFNGLLHVSTTSGVSVWNGSDWFTTPPPPTTFDQLYAHNGVLYGAMSSRWHNFVRFYALGDRGWSAQTDYFEDYGVDPGAPLVAYRGELVLYSGYDGFVRREGGEWKQFGGRRGSDPHVAIEHDGFLFVAGDFNTQYVSFGDYLGRWSSEPGPLSVTHSGLPRFNRGGVGWFSAWANGTGPFTFAWSRGGQPLVEGETPWGSIISGVNTSQPIIRRVSAEDGGEYRVEVKDICGTVAHTTVNIVIGCMADYDKNGTVVISDLFQFLREWFSGYYAAADVNSSDRVDTGDLFEFLGAWLGGC